MPILTARPAGAGWVRAGQTADGGAYRGVPRADADRDIPARGLAKRRQGLLETCANPRCGSGWLHLWRSRSAPLFEGGWICSAACTRARVEAAVRRELEGRGGEQQSYRHRIPLGLVML